MVSLRWYHSYTHTWRTSTMSSRPLSSVSVGTREVPGNYTTGWISSRSIDCRSNDCSNDCRSNDCRSIDCWINGKTPRICCMLVGWDVHWCPVSRMATPRHANARFEFRKRRGSCVSIVRRLDNPTLLHKIEKR